MGHYLADMACDDCGRARCVCPPKPTKPNKNWIVDDDYTPIQVDDFDRKYATVKTKYGSVPGLPIARRMGKKEFKTGREAMEHSLELMKRDLAALQDEAKHLKRLIKQTVNILNSAP